MVDESFGIDQRSIRTFVDVAVQDAVIKSLSRYCGEKMVISGAAICSDVNVAHIANVNGVMSAA